MIDIERDGAVHVVRLNRGPVNALDVDMLDALTETMRGLQGPVVLTGNGRVFSAGVDLRRLLAEDADYAGALLAALSAGFRAVFDHPGPTVAAIDGSAIAGGCVLALACDVRLMSAGRIGLVELAVGVPFPIAGLEIARYALGDTARRVVLRAGTFDPQEALTLGASSTNTSRRRRSTRARRPSRRSCGTVPPRRTRSSSTSCTGTSPMRSRRRGPVTTPPRRPSGPLRRPATGSTGTSRH